MRQTKLNFPRASGPQSQGRRDGAGPQQSAGANRSDPPRPNKAARARVAQEIIKNRIPALLTSNPRAAAGVNGSQLFHGQQDLPRLTSATQAGAGSKKDAEEVDDTFQKIPVSHFDLKVVIVPLDTFMSAHYYRRRRPNAKIAVLNMASTFGPGGGVLRGAQAQEEALCLRSTLYPSLQPQWYRLPEDGIGWTEDVLVFAEPDPQHVVKMLDKNDMWYVDVVSCAAIRKPGTKGPDESEYDDPRDEEHMVLKIRYIMRACAKMGVKIVVLGALGCGAYGNPIDKVAGMFRRILVGRHGDGKVDEDWAAAGIEEVAIAILDDTRGSKVWNGFAQAFANTNALVLPRPRSH